MLSRRRFVHLLGAGGVGVTFAPGVAARGLEAHQAGGLPGAVPVAHRAFGAPICLDSNENPNGPAPAAMQALRDALAQANRYAFDEAKELRTAIARTHGTDESHVVVGCGSTDVLRAAAHAYLTLARPLVTAEPSYESPVRDAVRLGAAVRAIPVDRALRLDLARMRDAARGAGLVYLCNPNNPTATVHGRDAVLGFLDAVARESPETTVLVDEAYHEYVDAPGYASMLPLALERPRLLVARTFSKVHGLAGLRVGYAVGHPETIAAVAPHVLGLGINGMGAAAALASLRSTAHLARERAANAEARAHTRRFFEGAGYASSDSAANFVMVDLRRDIRPFQTACREQGVLVGRLFPPLPTQVRISIGTMDEMRAATDVFRRVLAAV